MPPLDPTRCQRFTASMAPWLLSGSHDVIQRLWLQQIGDPRYVPDGFDKTWAALFGQMAEPLAQAWIQDHGYVLTDIGKQVFHRDREWCSATLDGRVVSRHGAPCNCVQDVKCINAFRDTDEAVGFYTPQCIVQRDCAGADTASLLFVKGGGEPQEYDVHIDPQYEDVVWAAIDAFWHCVETLTPPVPLHFPRVVAPSLWRKIDLDRDAEVPNWSEEIRELLTSWGLTRETAQTHEKVKQSIRDLIPDDVGRVLCGSFSVKRDRRNALTIRMRRQKGDRDG